MADLLRALDLKVIEWEQAAALTGVSSPYIGDVILAGFSAAQAAVVLMTPDDLACLHPTLLNQHDGANEARLRGQPKPNVIYEAGVAVGMFRNRTVLVEVGPLRGYSDIAGMHVVRLDGTPDSRHRLANRLSIAGCAVDNSGTDWLRAGNFSIDMPPTYPSEVVLGAPMAASPAQAGKAAATPTWLRSVPIRWVLLAKLVEQHEAQVNTRAIAELDLPALSDEIERDLGKIRMVLSEMLSEGLIEGFGETFGKSALDGACRITPAGLREWRQAG